MNRRTINRTLLAITAAVVLVIVGASLAGGSSSQKSSSSAAPTTYNFSPTSVPTTTTAPKFTVVDLERVMRKDINRQMRALGYATRVRRVLCASAGPYKGGKEFDCRVEAVGGGSVSKVAIIMPDGRWAYGDSQSDLGV